MEAEEVVQILRRQLLPESDVQPLAEVLLPGSRLLLKLFKVEALVEPMSHKILQVSCEVDTRSWQWRLGS